MTELSRRDIDPPEASGQPELSWELWLGYDLEQYYEYFTEVHFLVIDAFPDKVMDELTVMRRWMAFQLRELRIPELLIDAADNAAADIRRWTDISVIADGALKRRRNAIRDTFELLLQLTRAHVRRNRRRYFDFGVMLRRVNACTIMHLTTPTLPRAAHRAWPGLDEEYRAELWRSCSTLVSFVREDETINPTDPALSAIDAKFRALADYLESRLADERPVDEDFLEHLQAATFSAGLSESVKAAARLLRQERPASDDPETRP